MHGVISLPDALSYVEVYSLIIYIQTVMFDQSVSGRSDCSLKEADWNLHFMKFSCYILQN